MQQTPPGWQQGWFSSAMHDVLQQVGVETKHFDMSNPRFVDKWAGLLCRSQGHSLCTPASAFVS
jgi:hypothetical protein